MLKYIFLIGLLFLGWKFTQSSSLGLPTKIPEVKVTQSKQVIPLKKSMTTFTLKSGKRENTYTKIGRIKDLSLMIRDVQSIPWLQNGSNPPEKAFSLNCIASEGSNNHMQISMIAENPKAKAALQNVNTGHSLSITGYEFKQTECKDNGTHSTCPHFKRGMNKVRVFFVTSVR